MLATPSWATPVSTVTTLALAAAISPVRRCSTPGSSRTWTWRPRGVMALPILSPLRLHGLDEEGLQRPSDQAFDVEQAALRQRPALRTRVGDRFETDPLPHR